MKIALFFVCLIFLSCSDSKELRLQKFLLKGNLSLKERNTEQAKRYFDEALKIDPCFADALNNLGTINFQQKNWKEALGFYNAAVQCKPDFLLPYFNRANTYYELKEYYNAQQDVAKIISAKPDTAVAYFTQGLIATKMRDYAAALVAFDKAIRIDSTNVEYRVNRGTVKYYLQRFTDAENDLAIAMRLNPNEPNIYNTLAMIEISRGNHDKAFILVEKALRLSPNQPYFLNNRGFILLMQNRLPEALLDINQSILLDPENGWAYRNKGIYRLLSGDYDNALSLLKQALSMDSFIDKIHFYLGMTYLKNGQKKESCDQFKLSEVAGEKMLTVDLLKSCR